MKHETAKEPQYLVLKPLLTEDAHQHWQIFSAIPPILAIVLTGVASQFPFPLAVCIVCLFIGFLFYFFTSSNVFTSSNRSQLELKAKGLDIRDNRLDAIMPWEWLTKIEIRHRRLSLFPNYVTFTFKDGSDILILWNDIKETIDSTHLVSCVRTWAPHAEIIGDAQLTKSESLASYTELWLRELSTTSLEKRLRQDQLLTTGTILNEIYTVKVILSGGGQGTAYLAETTASPHLPGLPPLVVVKEFILPDNERGRKKATDDLLKEVALLRRINSPLIVHLYDFFLEDLRAYLVVEYIEGCTLRQLVRQYGKLEKQEVARIGDLLCQALLYLHELSPAIVHGDVTPDNIMIDRDRNGSIKLMDFDASQELTRNKTNTVVGKHSYMAPEQFKGLLSQSSDIYAVGCTLHFLLTGRDPEPLTESNSHRIISKATKLNKAERYQNLQELRLDLEQLR